MEGTASHTDAQTPSALVQTLRQTQRQADALVRLIQAQDPANSALTPEQRTSVLADLQTFVDAEIPTPRALYRATLAGGIAGQAIFVLWNRARQAFHASAPSVVDMFLAKMENEKLPYSERLLVEAMKGMGMLVPSTPQSDDERKVALSRDALRNMPDDELNRLLRDEIDGTDADAA